MSYLDDYYGFQLSITLGGDSILTTEDIAKLLEDTAKRIIGGTTDGKIVDANGNSTGQFGFMRGSRRSLADEDGE